LKAIEEKYGSKVITLIHRQETRSLFGFFMIRIITMEDSELVKIEQLKDPKDIDNQTLIKIDMSKKALKQMKDTVKEILIKKRHSEEKAEFIANELSQGKWTHDYSLTYDYLKSLGLNVSTEMPEEVYALMDLYPQLTGIPAVQYLPEPPIKRPEAIRK
jgi:hypothetical protein